MFATASADNQYFFSHIRDYIRRRDAGLHHRFTTADKKTGRFNTGPVSATSISWNDVQLKLVLLHQLAL
jgi:hypothetical protein